MLLEVVHVVVDLLQTFVRHCQRACRRVLDASLEHHAHHAVLQHLGVDVEVRHALVVSQCAQYGVGSAAHAALQRQERLRYDASLHVADEELCHVVSNLVSYRVGILEGSCLVGYVTFYNAHNLFGVYLYIGCAYAVVHVCDRYRLAARRVERLVYVVQIFCLGAVESVKLQHHVLCQACHCGADASGSRQVSLACVGAFLDVAHLNYRPVNLSHKAVAQLLCHVAQVDVVVGYLACVYVLAEVRVGGVGRAVFYSLRVR